MDGYEATKMVFSRIKSMDPENASNIMGLLLSKEHGEKEMIRLALSPESLIHSVIFKARKELGLPCSNNSPPTPSSTSPSPSPNFLSRQNSSTSSRLSSGFNLPPSLTIPNPSWGATTTTMSMSDQFQNHDDSDPIDDFQLQDQLSFLNDGSDPSYGWGGNSSLHRRSCSVNDAYLAGSEDPSAGLGWKPCLYFARGYCKNGTSCRFLHGDASAAAAAIVGSPNKIENMMDQYHHELLRSKSSHQQRFAAAAAASQLMASNSFLCSPKGMNFLLQQQQNQNDTQRAAAAALMMNEELHKFGRSRLERNDFSLYSPTGMINPASRQIYLTFPADSTFREEDVSEYFSKFGPVQDVRIPYQQKRMFGFVTFVFPETVKDILSKGNPHFVCEARVLVKPYKEKGKIPDKKQLQQQGDFSPCRTPTGLVDARDQYDLQLAERMFYNTEDMLWRRKEQAELQQQALEIQRRRLMGLQLLDIKNQHQRALSTGSLVHSPTQSPNMFDQNLVLPFRRSSEFSEVIGSNSASAHSNASVSAGQQSVKGYAGKEVLVNGENGNSESNENGKPSSSHEEELNLHECLELEHNLPDSPFASPTKAVGDLVGPFSNGPSETIDSDASTSSKFGTSKLLPTSASLDMGSFKPYNNCQLPRFSSAHGTIGMFAGTGGPIGI